jgi:type II secretory pathway component PulJ
MTEQTVTPQQVSKQLSQQKVRLQQVLTILENELDAIASRNGEQLVEIAKQKELQLESIRNADNALNNDSTNTRISST